MAQQNEGGNDTVSDDAMMEEGLVPFGKPRHLEELWRLHAHGRPQQLLPVDETGAHLVITNQAVFYRDGPDAQPDWLRRLDFNPSNAQVTQDGSKFVLGSIGFFSIGEPSIHVYDTATGKLLHESLSNEESLQQWTLTDVDGDDEDDVLGISLGGELTAMKLDGSVIYREATPAPGVHVPVLDLYMGLTASSQGLVKFADATGDGTKDLFFLSIVYDTYDWTPAVTLVSGASGSVEWSVLVDPWEDVWFALPAATGDLDGDGLADFFFQDSRFTGQERMSTKGVSGLDGRVILRDSGGTACVEPGLECDPAPYFPVAVADVTGDGQAELIGYSQGGDDLYPGYGLDGLEVRTPGPVEGFHSRVLDRHGFGFEFYGYFSFYTSNTPDLWVWENEAGYMDVELHFGLYSVYFNDGTGFNTEPYLFRVQDAQITQVDLPDKLAMFARHTGTGAGYGWSRADDRFVRLAEDGSRLDEGVMMIVGSYPMMFYDLDGDGVPDPLLYAGNGFRWMSGKNGTMLQEVPRPDEVRTLGAVVHKGTPWMIELHNETELVLWDLKGDREGPMTEITGLEEGFYVMDIWDFTGDGALEVFVREFDRWDYSQGSLNPQRKAGSYLLVSMESSEVLWEQSSEDHQAIPAPLLGRESTREILVLDRSGDEQVVNAWSMAKSKPLWTKELEEGEQVGALGMGLVAFLGPSEDEDEEDERLEIRIAKGGSGALEHTHRIDEPKRVTPLRFMDVGGTTDRLVVGHTLEREKMPESEKHLIEVVDWRLGRVQGSFEVTGPQIETHVVEGEDFSFSYTSTRTTGLGPSVGDWTGDGVWELTFSEYDEQWHGVVRNLKDGAPVAVGPAKGIISNAVDLNGDGALELVQTSNGVLRLLAFDPDKMGGTDDDDVRSFKAEDQAARDNRTKDFFGGGEKTSPGLPLIVFIGVVAVGVVVARRQERRRD